MKPKVKRKPRGRSLERKNPVKKVKESQSLGRWPKGRSPVSKVKSLEKACNRVSLKVHSLEKVLRWPKAKARKGPVAKKSRAMVVYLVATLRREPVRTARA